jgi:hypothetical protein
MDIIFDEYTKSTGGNDLRLGDIVFYINSNLEITKFVSKSNTFFANVFVDMTNTEKRTAVNKLKRNKEINKLLKVSAFKASIIHFYGMTSVKIIFKPFI